MSKGLVSADQPLIGDEQKHTAIASQIAQQVFGYEQLRQGQADVLSQVLNQRDTLAVMPTGSGKSAVYQIAALRLPGTTIVVSPLIALQQDQVESIQQQGIVQAALLNSTLSAKARAQVFEQLAADEIEFLFLAPEQFNNSETLEVLKAAQPSLFVIDEAHCISEWGHDFRPDYLQLAGVIAQLGQPVTLALTATASPLVRKEIIQRLGMRHAKRLQTLHIGVADMATVFAQMHRNSVRSPQFSQGSGPDGIGFGSTASLADGRDVIDVNSQQRHSCSSARLKLSNRIRPVSERWASRCQSKR